MGCWFFCLRTIIAPERWNDRLAGISVWSLNIGPAWMAFANLFPIGVLQLYDSCRVGYWHARELAFLLRPAIHALEWARFPGDLLFIAGGVLPLVWLALQAFLHPRAASTEGEAQALYEEVAAGQAEQ